MKFVCGQEVKKCPNCKNRNPSVNRIKKAVGSNWWFVECPYCLWSGGKGWGVKSAIRKWNRLTPKGEFR